MMKIEFDGIKLEVPNSWSDLRLEDYERFYLQRPETKFEYVQYVADVCKIDPKLLIESPTQLFDILVNAIGFIFKNEFEPQSKIVIGKDEYFISVSDKLTLGEWVDIDNIVESDSETKLSEMLAVLCRPAGEKYNPDLLEERKKLFRSLSCDKVLPLVSFFLFKKKKLEEISSHCSEVIAQANQFLEDTKNFARSGVGTKPYPTWRMIKYYFLMKSLEKQLSRFSDSFYTKETRQKPKKTNIILKNK